MTNTELREKLVEMIAEAKRQWQGGTNNIDGRIADHLIANGVAISNLETTTQKWIPVTERLPKSEKVVLVSVVSKQFGYRQTLRAAHIGHHEATTEDWREYEGDTEYDEENDCFWIPECWWESNAIEDNGNWIIDGDYDVTHWMPIPELPKEE